MAMPEKDPINAAFRKIAVTLLVAMLLYLLGTRLYESVIYRTLPHIDGITFGKLNADKQLPDPFPFSITLALVPISAVSTWTFAPIYAPKRKFINVLILVFSIFLASFVEYLWLVNQLEEIMRHRHSGSYKVYTLPARFFDPGKYMFLGLGIGTLVSYLLLRQPSGIDDER